MAGPFGPMWFDPAPQGYPWPMLMVPVNISSQEEVERQIDVIKQAGNRSLRRGEHYDALWKYNHALVLCRDHKVSPVMAAIISSNCAQACLNLKYYHDAYSHANGAIKTDPHSSILHKTHYRRAEATKLLYIEMKKKNAPQLPSLDAAIWDYCQSFYHKDVNHKAICEAIILAVDNSLEIPMSFRECHIESGATTRVLLELLSRPDSKHAHLSFLLLDMQFLQCKSQHFDCSSIQFREVCKKSLGKSLLRIMISFGMIISPEDVAHAVELLPDIKTATLNVIAEACKGPPHESLSLAYVAAEKLKKPQLLECLKKGGAVPPKTPQEKVAKFREEGNEYYRKSQYNEALAKYYQALPLCQQHKLEEEEALIRGNCAQACIVLELLKDAFEHANECLRLDPESSKGYYRRAEALRKMLESLDWQKRAPEGYSFSNVVNDYFQCHRKAENTKAIYQAMVVATNHNCTKSLPSLTNEEIASGLATKILMELVQRDDSQQKHFTTLLCTLVPETIKSGVDASSLRVTDLLKEKSITRVKLVKRLVRFGMKVTETDVSSAVQILPEHHKSTLEVLAKECIKTRKSTFTAACQEAIKAKKLQFIVCLIENGGMPDVEDLKDVTKWPKKKVDPIIDRYLMENSRSTRKMAAEKENFEVPEIPDVDIEAIRTAAKRSLEQGEILLKAGQIYLSLKELNDALQVCLAFNLAEEACDVYYTLAKLHVTIGNLESAFATCSESLKIHRTAKMHYLRATVLHNALISANVTVPSAFHPGIVVKDYCESHRLQDNVNALTEAIIFAVDHRRTSVIHSTKQEPLMAREHVKSGFCTELLLNLLKHKKAKPTHVRFLLEIPIHAPKPHFDGSKVALSVLIKKKLVDDKVLKYLFQCGVNVVEKDIKMAVETLSGDSTSTLDILCKHFQGDLPSTLNVVCPIAMEAKKIKFVLCLLKKGCKLPCTSQEALMLALQKNFTDIAESLLPFCTLSEVDLGQLMSTCKSLVNYQQLIVKMIDGGVNPSGLGEQKPLAEVLKVTNVAKKMELLCLLIGKGCDCTHLCVGSKYPTTPVHVATTIGLEAGGSTKVLDAVVSSKSFSLPTMDGKLVDGKGCTPLHIAMNKCWKRDHSAKIMKALIETHKIPIDPSIRNQQGKRAADFLAGKGDKRRSILEMATTKLQKAAAGKKSEKVQKETKKVEQGAGSAVEGHIAIATYDQSDGKGASDTMEEIGKDEMRKDPYEMLSIAAKLEFHLKRVLGKDEDYFVTVTEQQHVGDNAAPQVHQTDTKKEIQSDQLPGVVPSITTKKSPSPQPLPKEDDENEMNTVMSKYGLDDFDGLPWEVEVTNNVLKFFKSEKEHPYPLRLRAARTVYELAEGRRSGELAKEVSGHTANLFEAKMSKGGRILWQRAIQFSPRRTGEHCNPIYAQVIRIWEIVPDHDQLNQTIKACVKHIELANEKGLKASLNITLIPQKEMQHKQRSVRKQVVLDIPKIFTQADVSITCSDVQRYTPAASPKEDEFNVTTFYSFSGAVLKSMLTGSNSRRDFPFKEWPKEHEIINLPPDRESILLLGRSGTGKTTCCLYRLWNEFKIYWDRPSIIMLPRKPLLTLKLPVKEEEEVDSNDTSQIDEGDEDDTKVASVVDHAIADEQMKCIVQTEDVYDEDCDSDKLSQKDSEDEDTLSSSSDAACSTARMEEVGEIEEHLHQVFVTKNYVLCAQMKKRFYDMAAAHDFLEKHMDWESRNMPHSLTDIDTHAYPLFLTARQFYILLDNSIGDEPCFFRPRENDGSLKVKILSSDYDHEDPDTLLDLEETDSEGEDTPNDTDYAIPFTAKQQAQKYVEVTSLYFTECIWPTISKKCGSRNLDPMLVWIEIQSFIKGSRAALLKGSALPLEEYEKIGYKMAPNFANERKTIYKLYKQYEEYCQNKRHSVFLFDECDLVHDIHRRLRVVQDLPWSIHSLYIDEVQDFTQAELALYLHCCRHPNSLFFTGDTAQSIMRGIAFRFQDLRSSFYAIHEVVPQVRVPQEPHTLTINFRSHSGILQLAGSIIDLLQMFFKGSIDHLPSDNGMFSGPTPVILDSCEESDLALLLSSNKRESSRIEFGAHQVILVQSKEAKDSLPTILKGAIVLTIFESKGLEFDDVLLYNFFHDSMVDEKGWRVVTAYLEENIDSILVNKRLPGSTADPRSNKFDERSHKALNSELKYLYTAITRAKCNLWIYDTNRKKRLPMFDLWYKRNLVKIVGNNIAGVEDRHSLIFASISTSHQWKIQGDYFMRRCRWEQAKHCYDRAGPENKYLSVEANARFIVQQATRQAKPQMYLDAAVDFLYRDQLMHSVQCLIFSAQCLRRAKPQKFSFAAEMFEKLGKYGEALKCYRKIKDTVNCVRLLEREDRYDEAVKMIRAPKEALAKAIEYASKGMELSPELMPDNLSYMYAGQCAKRKDKTMLFEMLKYMTDPHGKARFMKISGLYTNAMEVYEGLDELDEAYRLAAGQCLFSDGRMMARKHKDLKKEAQFVFHQIHAEVFIRNRDNALPQDFEADLHHLLKTEDTSIKAHASLLLGMAKKDAGLCRAAHGKFLACHWKVAALEAFDALTNIGKYPKPKATQVLKSCTAAKEVMNALEGMNDLNQLVKQATAFYGLQKVRDVYLMAPNHNMWVSSKLQSQCIVSDEPKDLDGMLRLQLKETKGVLASHVGSFIRKWLDKYGIKTEILKKLHSFKLHHDIEKKQYLLRLYTRTEISTELLKTYMEAVVDYCSLGLLINQGLCYIATRLLLAVFSPQVSLCLPLSKQHVTTVRLAVSIHKYFHETIRQYLDDESCNRMDKWFSAWRACALCDGKTDRVETVLHRLEETVNHQFRNKPTQPVSSGMWKGGKFQPPFAYQYWNLEKFYYHIFSYWLYSCTLIRDEKKPLWAAKQAIYHFIGKVVQRKSLSISVINLVNVLIIHCMSIYAMLTELNHQQNKMATEFIVPLSYDDCVILFDALNCHQTGHSSVYASDIEDVKHHIRRSGEVTLEKNCCDLLDTALSILLGTYRKDTSLPEEEQKRFKVILFAFRNEKVLSSGAARHCLVLAVTLFVNLIPLQNQNTYEKYRRLFSNFFFNILRIENVPAYLQEGMNIFQSSPTMQILRVNLVQYVGRLLSEGCTASIPTQALMRINEKGKISFTPLPSERRLVSQSHPPLKPSHAPVIQQPLNTTASPLEASLQRPHALSPSQAINPTLTATKEPYRARENRPHDSHHPPFSHTAMQPDTSLPLRKGTDAEPYNQPSQSFYHPTTEIQQHSSTPSVVSQPQPYTASSSQAFSPTLTATQQQMVSPPQTSRENQPQYSHHQSFSQPIMQPHTLLPQPTSMAEGPHQPSQSFYHPMQQHSGHINVPLDMSLLSLSGIENHPSSLPFGQTMSHSIPPLAGSELPWENFPPYEAPTPVGGTHFYHHPFDYNMQQLSGPNAPPIEPSHPTSMPSYTYWDGSTQVESHYTPFPLIPEYQSQQSRMPPGPFGVPPVSAMSTTQVPHWENASQDTVHSHLSNATHPAPTPSTPHATMQGPSKDIPEPVHTYPFTHDVSAIQQSTEQIQESPVPFIENESVSRASLNDTSHDAIHVPPEVAIPPEDYDEANLPSLNLESDEEQSAAEQLDVDEDDMPSMESTNEPILEEEELGEDEEGAEEAPGMSAMRKSKWPQLPTIDPALRDPNIVTEQFCNVCGVSLRQSNAGEDSEEPDGESVAMETDENEIYDTHVRSTGHAQQHAHHKKFKELFDGCYSGMVVELTDLLHKCERIQAATLTRLTDEMQDTLNKYERKMADHHNDLEWKMGIKDIDKATDKFQHLLTRGNKQYQKVVSEQPWKMTDQGKASREEAGDAEDSDTEFQAEINKTVEVEVDDDFTLEPRSEKAKLAARSRKKQKKRKR